MRPGLIETRGKRFTCDTRLAGDAREATRLAGISRFEDEARQEVRGSLCDTRWPVAPVTPVKPLAPASGDAMRPCCPSLYDHERF